MGGRPPPFGEPFGEGLLSKPFGARPGGGRRLPFGVVSPPLPLRGGGSCGRGGGRLLGLPSPLLRVGESCEEVEADLGGGLPEGRIFEGDVFPS